MHRPVTISVKELTSGLTGFNLGLTISVPIMGYTSNGSNFNLQAHTMSHLNVWNFQGKRLKNGLSLIKLAQFSL